MTRRTSIGNIAIGRWRNRKERGAALLTVLLLVAVMAVISATAVERLTLTTRLAASSGIAGQARQAQLAAESLALRRIDTQLRGQRSQLTLEGGWYDKPFSLPLPGGGAAELRLTDGGNCFNVNSLVSDSAIAGRVVRPFAIEQFVALMEGIGIAKGEAQHIAFSATDWIDPDQNTLGNGAEDNAYAGYRTPDGPMSDAEELRAVSGVTPAIWARLKPWVCALPTDDLSPVNPNTLLPEQAPIVMMLIPGKLEPAQARALIAQRPASGYGRVERFWSPLTAEGITPPEATTESVKLTSRWFRLRSRIQIGDVTFRWSSLIDTGNGTQPARVVRRSWGPEE